MNKINATIVADSICNKNRITSMILTIPQIVVKELLRHRMFSFSSSSMRAIPFKKVIDDTKEHMFIPLAFQRHHSGMQGTEYLSGKEAEKAEQQWIETGLKACDEAERLYNLEVTKQMCSRIIEPFGYAKILVTSTEFENFFNLRLPRYEIDWYPSNRPEALEPSQATFRSKKEVIKYTEKDTSNWTLIDWLKSSYSSAEIHIQALAEAMWDARNESIPTVLQPGEWHIPLGNDIKDNEALGAGRYIAEKNNDHTWGNQMSIMNKVKIATARCARLSYMTFNNQIDYGKDIELHDRLLADKHMSPFEHCARVMDDVEFESYHKGQFVPESDSIAEDIGMAISNDAFGWCNNFKGFIPYRYLIENK